MKEEKRAQVMQKTAVVWLGALICCALWGSAFPCIKIGYQMFEIDAADTAAQILFAGYRFTLAGILTRWRENFDNDAVVSVDTLIERGIVKNPRDGVKILGNGELTKKLTVQANAFSASAKEKIEALGGKAEVI